MREFDKKLSTSEISSTSQPFRAGDTWTESATGMEFVWVQEGCNQMGSYSGKSDEKPVHVVCVGGFWMGKYEVTNQQYRMFKSGHISKAYEDVTLNQDHQPVGSVSWHGAKAFAVWLSKKTGKKFALPSEAQWEYAARAGTATSRYWGDEPDTACRYANVHDVTSRKKFSGVWANYNCDDGYAGSSPVGSFTPNNFGLYDMLGNVWEWCEDVYDAKAYSKHSRNNPLVTSGGSDRVIRSGSFGPPTKDLRFARRPGLDPGDTNVALGFRLIRTE